MKGNDLISDKIVERIKMRYVDVKISLMSLYSLHKKLIIKMNII